MNSTRQHKTNFWVPSECLRTSFTWQTDCLNHHMRRIPILRVSRKWQNLWRNENWRKPKRTERCLTSSKGNRRIGIIMCPRLKQSKTWGIRESSHSQCCESKQSTQTSEIQRLMRYQKNRSLGMVRKTTKYNVMPKLRNHCPSSSLKARVREA
jgi:hypothetical protein